MTSSADVVMPELYFIKMNKKFYLLCLFVLSISSIHTQSIRLKWIDTHPTTVSGVSFGVPFVRSVVSKNQHFVIQDTKGNCYDTQQWPLAYWPDGSVKWMGIASVIPGASDLCLKACTDGGERDKMKVTETQNQIFINTGALSCTINKTGPDLIQNIAVGSTIVAGPAALLGTIRQYRGNDTIVLSHFTSCINNAVVEQTGNIRTVVRLDGVHIIPGLGKSLFPFTVRLYFFKNQTSFRCIHSFVFDADQQTDFIQSIGIRFDVPLRDACHNRHVRFSGQNNGLWSEAVKPLIGRYPVVIQNDKDVAVKQFNGEPIPDFLPSDSAGFSLFRHLPVWDDYKLVQIGNNQFSVSKRTNDKSSWLHAADGNRASGLAMIGDTHGGLAVALKDFWQAYPTAFEINHATSDHASLTAWFWSPDAQPMDLRHYDTIPHNLDATYEDVQPGLSTPYGIARTHELTITVFDTLISKNTTLRLASGGCCPPQLVCTPEYYHQTRAFGEWSLPSRNTPARSWVEDQLDSAFSFYKRAVDEHNWYGCWNYGDIMHSYDPVRHVWKYDIGGFAWDNTELAPNNWLWYFFLRSGRADVFRFAEALTRHTSEVDVYHLGELKGLGSRHNVSHWGCGSKEARIGQALWKRFYFYLTTDERCGDLMSESLDAEKAIVKYDPLRIAQPRDQFPFSGPARLRWGPDWLALAGNWMTAWERTGNICWKNKILAGLTGLSALPDNLFTGPNGLNYDPQTGNISYDGKKGLTNKNHLATIMGGFEMLTELFDVLDCKEFRKKFAQYGLFYSMPDNDPLRQGRYANWGGMNFLNPRLTAFAARELKDGQVAARAWREFLGLQGRKPNPKSVGADLYDARLINGNISLNPVHENPTISTNATAQWGLNAIFMLELIGDKIPENLISSQHTTNHSAEKKRFDLAFHDNWTTCFEDDMKSDWHKKWFLDGERASLTNSADGLLFKAGPVAAADADHAVLWTKQNFTGDVRVDFDFVKIDELTRFVNILYLFASGSGVGEYAPDIASWNQLRTIPAMKTYFEHMKAYHISFAAFENTNTNPADDYIRARCYLPERGMGLTGTEIKPDYAATAMFKKDSCYHICVIRKGNDLMMQVTGDNKEYITAWKMNSFPMLDSGRIGLRLMGGRISQFRNFKIYKLK